MNHDLVTVHHIKDVEAITALLRDLGTACDGEPSHLEEHIGQAPEKLFLPSVTTQCHARLLDKVVADSVSAAIAAPGPRPRS